MFLMRVTKNKTEKQHPEALSDIMSIQSYLSRSRDAPAESVVGHWSCLTGGGGWGSSARPAVEQVNGSGVVGSEDHLGFLF